MEAACDRQLGELERALAVLVVEEQLDFGEVRRGTFCRAREKNVVRLLRAELRRAEASGGPDDRVGDVGLARAVRADDDGYAGLEANLDGIGERLETADFDGP
jgi:hypothetical protein